MKQPELRPGARHAQQAVASPRLRCGLNRSRYIPAVARRPAQAGATAHGQPIQKIARTGKLFVVAKVRAHAGDADVFVNVIAFSQAACEALLALGDGDAVALAGSLTPKAWTDREGTARPALDLVASQVLTAYHVTRKRKVLEPQQASRHDELDNGAPLDF